MRGQIGYADALKILGAGNSKALEVVGRLFGGAALAGAAATGQLGLVALLDVRDELVKLGDGLLSKLGQRVRGAAGKSRTDLLVAAHAVVAVDAYFAALRDPGVSVDLAGLLSAEDQLSVVGAPVRAESLKLVDALLRAPAPLPASYRPYEQTVLDMQHWYLSVSTRLLALMKGLAVWDELNESRRDELAHWLLHISCGRAAERYEEGFRRLAVDCPEFRMWMSLTDGAATRAAIGDASEKWDSGLAGLRALLESLASDRPSAEWPSRLAMAYRAQLERPIAETSPGEALAGLAVPALGAAYINPRLRVADFGPEARPADESWWGSAVVCDDVQWFLAGLLTSPAATEVPLVVLGQPGSGKSLLTKVLSAGLPPEDYLPVRVELRHVPSDAPLQDQIEAALREATGERMDWPDLVRSAGDVLPVVMLDGFDELLQGTGVSHASYLEEVRDFQRREAAQGRRVAFIVTSRTVVANRVRFPEGTVVAKMEPFDDQQIERWLAIWNDTNASYFSHGGLQELRLSAVRPHRELAEQPLLLLMLAFYDADRNALQDHSLDLARADLYEGLLVMFVAREVDKQHENLDKNEKEQLTNSELDELSVVAFAMFNRLRKSVSEDDLNNDLAALLRADATADPGHRVPGRLSLAQLALGRFFFIHKSQDLVDTARVTDYEFLHATFGEYLVARLICKILDGLIELSKADQPGFSVRSGPGLSDDRLWELLSFAPLSDGSQILGFSVELVQQRDDEQIRVLRRVLARLFRASLQPRASGYVGYLPRRLAVPARHAAYSANLLMLSVLAAEGPLRASALLGGGDLLLQAWRSHTLLWKSQLDPAGWDGLISAFAVDRMPGGDSSDLAIRYDSARLAQPLEYFSTIQWMTAKPETHETESLENGSFEEAGVSAEKTALQAAFLCTPELDLLMNGLQPLLRVSPRAFGDIIKNVDGRVVSAIHGLLAALIENSGIPASSSRASVVVLDSRQLAGIQDPSSHQLELVHNLVGKIIPSNTLKAPESALAWLAQSPNETSARWPSFGSALHAAHQSDKDLTADSDPHDSFAAVKFQLSGYATSRLGTPLAGLSDIEKTYAKINPILLAAAKPSFIADVLNLARKNNLLQWAAIQGLTVLAAMEPEKITELPQEAIDFVLHAADEQRSEVIQRIRKNHSRADDAPAAAPARNQ